MKAIVCTFNERLGRKEFGNAFDIYDLTDFEGELDDEDRADPYPLARAMANEVWAQECVSHRWRGGALDLGTWIRKRVTAFDFLIDINLVLSVRFDEDELTVEVEDDVDDFLAPHCLTQAFEPAAADELRNGQHCVSISSKEGEPS